MKEIKKLLFELNKLSDELEGILEQGIARIRNEKLLSEYIDKFKAVFIKRNIDINSIFNDVLKQYHNVDLYDLMEIIEWFTANIECMNSKWAKFFIKHFYREG